MNTKLSKHQAAFEEWAGAFKKLKDAPSLANIKAVIERYQERPPIMALRQQWKHDPGYRKLSHDGQLRGEQKIERLLFGGTGGINTIYIHKEGKGPIELRVSEHNFPLAAFKKGQVISDAFAFHKDRDRHRPVALEVKQTDGTPWYAVVENLIQVRLARSNLIRIESHGSRRLTEDEKPQEIIDLGPRPQQHVRGAWGMVIGPPAYYKKSDYALTLESVTSGRAGGLG